MSVIHTYQCLFVFTSHRLRIFLFPKLTISQKFGYMFNSLPYEAVIYILLFEETRKAIIGYAKVAFVIVRGKWHSYSPFSLSHFFIIHLAFHMGNSEKKVV